MIINNHQKLTRRHLNNAHIPIYLTFTHNRHTNYYNLLVLYCTLWSTCRFSPVITSNYISKKQNVEKQSFRWRNYPNDDDYDDDNDLITNN